VASSHKKLDKSEFIGGSRTLNTLASVEVAGVARVSFGVVGPHFRWNRFRPRFAGVYCAVGQNCAFEGQSYSPRPSSIVARSMVPMIRLVWCALFELSAPDSLESGWL
jgi:hypothetical protein